MEIVTCRPIGLVWLIPTLRKISSEAVVWLCPICQLGIIAGLCYSPGALCEGVHLSWQNHGQARGTCQMSRKERFRTTLGLKFWMSNSEVAKRISWESSLKCHNYQKSGVICSIQILNFDAVSATWNILSQKMHGNNLGQHRAGLILTGSRTWWLCFFGIKWDFVDY